MVDTGDDVHPAERLAAHADVHNEAWEQTVEEMRAMADARREDGLEAVTVPAGHTGTAAPETDDADRLGLVFVIPGDTADDAEALVAEHDLDQFEVYRRTVSGRVFLVVEYFDPDAASLFVAANYRLADAGETITAAREEGAIATYLQKLDGTPVAEFEHADVSKFVPDDQVPDEA